MKKIILYPNIILNRECKKVKEISSISLLLKEMEEVVTFYDAHGIAANQLGVAVRAIFVNTKDFRRTLINPRIIDQSGKEIEEEGCLSFPGIKILIERATKITVEYEDETGQEVSEDAYGLNARVIQHEIDHLNGINLYKKTTSAEKSILLGKLQRNKRKLKNLKK